MATKRQIAEQVLRILAGGTPSKDFPIDIKEIMYALEQERDTMISTYLQAKFNKGDYSIDGHLLNEDIITMVAKPGDSIPKKFYLADVNGDTSLAGWYIGYDDANNPIPEGAEQIAAQQFEYAAETSFGDGSVLPYAKLNRAPITLPNGRGIYQVRMDTAPHQRGYGYDETEEKFLMPSRPFYPMTMNSSSLHWGLNSLRGFGRNGYFLQGKTMYFAFDDLNNIPWSGWYLDENEQAVWKDVKVRVVYIAATRDINDDENMPIPAEQESLLVKNLVQTFSVMIQRPEDEINDNIKA